MTKYHLKKCKSSNKGICTRHTPSVIGKARTAGITLIALIITIIVLLILAGVTIAALTGTDSAPVKANEAKQKNDIGSAQDQVYLIAQTAQTEAYERVYVEGKQVNSDELVSAKDSSRNVGTYVKNKVHEQFPENGTKKVGLATIKAKANGKITIRTTDFSVTGKINDLDGTLTWNEVRSATTEEGTSITSAISSSNYGEYVDLDTSILDLQNVTLSDGTHPSADWRVFYKDSAGGMYVILSDYIPYDKIPSKAVGDKKLKRVGTSTYCVNGANQNCLAYAMKTEMYWKDITNKGKTTGGIPIEIFVESYNETHPNDTKSTADSNKFNVDSSNTLYVPHNSSLGEEKCQGYWFASPNRSYCCWVLKNGFADWEEKYDSTVYGIRPVVYLEANTEITKTGSVWTVISDETAISDTNEINIENYGEYVNLNTNILDLPNITLSDGTHPTTDWRIMYKDTTGVWLILSDYLPFEKIPSEAKGNNKIRQVGTKVYSVRSSSNGDLVNTLETESNWSSLTDKGIVKGAVPINVLFASYSQAYPGDNDTDDSNFCFDTTDTLFVPHNSSDGVQECKGYWLPRSNRTWDVWGVKNGHVSTYDQEDDGQMGIRPVVFIDTSTKQLVKKANSSVWTIEQ